MSHRRIYFAARLPLRLVNILTKGIHLLKTVDWKIFSSCHLNAIIWACGRIFLKCHINDGTSNVSNTNYVYTISQQRLRISECLMFIQNKQIFSCRNRNEIIPPEDLQSIFKSNYLHIKLKLNFNRHFQRHKNHQNVIKCHNSILLGRLALQLRADWNWNIRWNMYGRLGRLYSQLGTHLLTPFLFHLNLLFCKSSPQHALFCRT